MGEDCCEPKEPCIRWDPDLPRKGVVLRRCAVLVIVAFLRMSAFCIVRLVHTADECKW